jgi:hypothetical protein
MLIRNKSLIQKLIENFYPNQMKNLISYLGIDLKMNQKIKSQLDLKLMKTIILLAMKRNFFSFLYFFH